ncbi:hypothetical protein [Chryseobacterium koreense]|uniref:Uncharacterized protein n=1 Tax=Chryseobacterium koreense CCUG 49689 TaxID=1304281 RepID=A0A0J7IYZ0_9FLAO|nr:hypothetical protein [Chryseobacterium koreense]KMQ71458.1 hypothetical protein ACM44_06395 [Chryseobacterium koreense CCUG 49689]MBB5333719.1 superfamily I DNA/RNA helicase [Chryseobacterium koreense]
MENQNTTPNEPQNDIYELLRKTIATNEANVQAQNEAKSSYLEVKKLIESFQDKIPESVELKLDEDSAKLFQDLKNLLQEFKYCTQSQKNFFFGSIGVLFLAVIILFGTNYFAFQWYSESIRAKSEIKQEILDEIKRGGKAIYKIEDYNQLKYNTDLMNKWMKKNPRDGEKFMKFKEGFESK